MIATISPTLLVRLADFVTAQLGLSFPMKRWRDLERGIAAAAREFGFGREEACIEWLLSSSLTRNQVEILASHLTVGETYFFREKKSFEVLEQNVLPEVIRSRRGGEQRLRIWSAGCATGEEPYSLAILLRRMLPDVSDWNITILATDINLRFLSKAAEGVYTEWAFRGTPRWIKESYFEEKKEGVYEILDHIKRMVTFSHLNLAGDPYPSLLNNTNAMDIIFCRNVLMYFAPERAKKVVQDLYKTLMDGGWLLVSPSETSHVLFPQFRTIIFPDVIIYKKDSVKSSVAEKVVLKENPSYTPPAEAALTLPQASGFSVERTPEIVPVQVGEDGTVQELQAAEPVQTAYMEALSLYEEGRYAQAAEILRAPSLNDQETPRAITLLVRTYANQGRLTEALEWCESAIATDKLEPELHYLHANILQERGVTEEAIASLKKALYLSPDFVLAHFALGNLLLREGRSRAANKHFENALSLLGAYDPEEILPESEGMTAGRLREIIRLTIHGENSHEEKAVFR
jgi:chemotaxis protein methyltransferase CheR